MQKVHSYYLFKISLELLIKLLFQLFPSRYFYTIAYIFSLALEEGSPIFKQIFFRFTFTRNISITPTVLGYYYSDDTK